MTLYAMVTGARGLYRVKSFSVCVVCPSEHVRVDTSIGVFDSSWLRIGELHHWQAAAANEPDVARAVEAVR